MLINALNVLHVIDLSDENSDSASGAIENIADAVTHARFVGTDPSSDEVVLMKILHVRRIVRCNIVGYRHVTLYRVWIAGASNAHAVGSRSHVDQRVGV